MPITHGVAAGMGGIRTAGDLVMWMQMTRKMKIQQQGANQSVMRDVRENFGIGTITAIPGVPRGIAAKRRIGELLEIEINSVNKMWHKS